MHRLVCRPESGLKTELEPGYAVVVAVNLTDGMSHRPATWIEALMAFDEIETRKAELLHCFALLRRQSALNQNVTLFQMEGCVQSRCIGSRH